MVLRIFLESKIASGTITGSGHLYLVLRDVAVDANGDVVSNIVTANDRLIHGFPNVTAMHLNAAEEILAGSADGYGVPGDLVPIARHSRDITSAILTNGGYASALSAWAAMTAIVNSLGAADYDYEFPDANSNHLANSNAVALSVLNSVGVDVSSRSPQ